MIEIKKLIALEDKLIYQNAITLLNSDDLSAPVNAEVHESANARVSDIAACIHRNFLLELISIFVSSKFSNGDDVMRVCFDNKFVNLSGVSISEIDAIPALCEQLHISFLNSKFSISIKSSKVRTKSKEQLIELGAVYTQSHIARSIVDDTFANLSIPLKDAKVLDFACGTGRFYENIIPHYHDKKKAILSNVYAIDVDINALNITRLKALSFIETISEEECNILCKHIVLKDGFRKTIHFSRSRYIFHPKTLMALLKQGSMLSYQTRHISF